MARTHDAQIVEPAALSLRQLNEQITRHYPRHPSERDSPAEVFAMAAFLVSLVASLIAAFFLPATWARVILLLGMAVEMLSAIVYIVLGIRSFDRERMKERFASELDADYRAQIIIIQWIRSHDRPHISNAMRFVRTRLASLERRAGVLVGGIEKLGGLPIAVALFLQFKDVQITGPLSINWTAWFLSLLVVALYIVGLYAQSLKFRLHLYENLLEEALHENTDASVAGR